MFFNKSILATTLAVFASGVVGQIIEIEYGTSQSNAYSQKVQLQELTELDEPGDYSYFSTPDICDLYSNTEDYPALSNIGGTGEIPTTYIDAVYCYTQAEEDPIL
ncbi:hypothetical protein AnigIFM50267_000418 [Aspergillus niger]|nr:hypothetical protein AnigIFM50267_000418 [Aspergillus niger]